MHLLKAPDVFPEGLLPSADVFSCCAECASISTCPPRPSCGSPAINRLAPTPWPMRHRHCPTQRADGTTTTRHVVLASSHDHFTTLTPNGEMTHHSDDDPGLFEIDGDRTHLRRLRSKDARTGSASPSKSTPTHSEAVPGPTPGRAGAPKTDQRPATTEQGRVNSDELPLLLPHRP
jgi:hypothetical protein